MARKSNTGIPFQSKDPRYQKVWARMKSGNTLEEALKDIDTHRAAGRGGGQQPKYLKGKRAPPVKNVTVHADDLLQDSPQPGPKDPPCPVTATETDSPLLKELRKTNVFLGVIARALEQIANREAPQPGQEGTGTMRPAPGPAPMVRREAENGLIVGSRVKQIRTGDVGQVTRIMPGKKDVEVRFMLGSKTLPIDQVEPVPGASV